MTAYLTEKICINRQHAPQFSCLRGSRKSTLRAKLLAAVVERKPKGKVRCLSEVSAAVSVVLRNRVAVALPAGFGNRTMPVTCLVCVHEIFLLAAQPLPGFGPSH